MDEYHFHSILKVGYLKDIGKLTGRWLRFKKSFQLTFSGNLTL